MQDDIFKVSHLMSKIVSKPVRRRGEKVSPVFSPQRGPNYSRPLSCVSIYLGRSGGRSSQLIRCVAEARSFMESLCIAYSGHPGVKIVFFYYSDMPTSRRQLVTNYEGNESW